MANCFYQFEGGLDLKLCTRLFFLCVPVPVWHLVEVRGQHVRVASPFPRCGLWRSNLGPRAWWQVSVPTRPCSLRCFYLIIRLLKAGSRAVSLCALPSDLFPLTGQLCLASVGDDLVLLQLYLRGQVDIHGRFPLL